MKSDELLTMKEAAERLRVSRSTFYAVYKDKQLKTVRRGIRGIGFRAADVMKLLAELQEPTPKPHLSKAAAASAAKRRKPEADECIYQIVRQGRMCESYPDLKKASYAIWSAEKPVELWIQFRNGLRVRLFTAAVETTFGAERIDAF
jgi:excisionase family DNA binding protein